MQFTMVVLYYFLNDLIYPNDCYMDVVHTKFIIYN